MAFSSGAATVCSMTSALAPGYTATTLTTGGAISGYWAIGSVRIADRPAMTKKIDSTAAKMGRSMKKREHARELAGLERTVGVGHLGLGFDGAGVARHPRVGENELALARVHGAVGEVHLDVERALLGQLELARGGLAAPAHLVGVGDA